MNRHILIDRMTAFIGALAAGKQKFFTESIESPSFRDYFADFSFEIPKFNQESIYTLEETIYDDTLDPAFWVYKWMGPKYPTIVYHHGNNENPFQFGKVNKQSFQLIMGSNRSMVQANIIVVRAPFHGGKLKEYTEKIVDLKNFVALIAASVVLIEKLIQRLRQQSGKSILVSGISLGGWVTNLHRTHFQTADAYIPLLAGAALGEVFLTSRYQKLTGELALNNPEVIRKVLNFEVDFNDVKTLNVYPLLGRFDQFIQYDRQSEVYQNIHPVKVIEKGHVTSLLASELLREHLLQNLQTD